MKQKLTQEYHNVQDKNKKSNYDPRWESISWEELHFLLTEENMSDRMISGKFGVSVREARTKRKKYNLSQSVKVQLENEIISLLKMKKRAFSIPLIISIVVALAVFIKPLVITFLFRGNDGESNDAFVQTLLNELGNITMSEVLLSIIGVAVTVWIGLNIYNIASKDEMEKLTTRATELNNQLGMFDKRIMQVNKAIATEALVGQVTHPLHQQLAKLNRRLNTC